MPFAAVHEHGVHESVGRWDHMGVGQWKHYSLSLFVCKQECVCLHAHKSVQYNFLLRDLQRKRDLLLFILMYHLYPCTVSEKNDLRQCNISKPISWAKSLSHALIYSSTFGADVVPRWSAKRNTRKRSSDWVAMEAICIFQLGARPGLGYLT